LCHLSLTINTHNRFTAILQVNLC